MLVFRYFLRSSFSVSVFFDDPRPGHPPVPVQALFRRTPGRRDNPLYRIGFGRGPEGYRSGMGLFRDFFGKPQWPVPAAPSPDREPQGSETPWGFAGPTPMPGENHLPPLCIQQLQTWPSPGGSGSPKQRYSQYSVPG